MSSSTLGQAWSLRRLFRHASYDPTYLDPTSLAGVVDENLYDLFRAMAQGLSRGELDKRDELSRHHSFPFNPMFKGVWRTRLAPDRVDQAIDDTIAWFQARQAPFFFWWTGASTTPAGLGERLQARGLLDMAEQQVALAPGIKQTELGAPCMAADLQRMNETALATVPAEFRSVYERIGFRATGTRINRYLWRNA